MNRNLTLAGKKPEAPPPLADGTPCEIIRRRLYPARGSLQAGIQTYPFPVHDPSYLEKTMEEHIAYFSEYSPATNSSPRHRRKWMKTRPVWSSPTSRQTRNTGGTRLHQPCLEQCESNDRTGHYHLVHHSPRAFSRYEHHLCESGIPVCGNTGEQYGHIRNHREHERVVAVASVTRLPEVLSG